MAVKWQPPANPSDTVGTGHKWGEQVSQEGFHKGVDLQITRGKPALSPVDGTVVDVNNDPEGLGITVAIQDESGHVHTLGHLDGVHVKVGDRVKGGQQVADVGSTGASTGPHLDYRLQDANGQHQDPTALLGPLAQMPRADVPGAEQAGMGQGWQPPGAGQSAPLAMGKYRWDVVDNPFGAGQGVGVGQFGGQSGGMGGGGTMVPGGYYGSSGKWATQFGSHRY
jgi:hypothetical protein